MNQLQSLKKMTGEQRLEQAFQLSELTRELAIANIKKNLGKKVTKAQVLKELRKRLYD